MGAQYAASGATFRLSRFGRKVVAVARLKKVNTYKQVNKDGSKQENGEVIKRMFITTH